MKIRVKYRSKLMRGNTVAWVLYPYMFFRDLKGDVSDSLFRHELEHVYQVEKEGWLRFYITYLFRLIKYGYKDHPDEDVARLASYIPLTPIERALKNG